MERKGRILKGWAKSYRQDTLSALKGKTTLIAIYSVLTNLANYKDGNKILTGEVLTSGSELASFIGKSPKTIYRGLDTLVSLSLIEKCRQGWRGSNTEGLRIRVLALVSEMSSQNVLTEASKMSSQNVLTEKPIIPKVKTDVLTERRQMSSQNPCGTRVSSDSVKTAVLTERRQMSNIRRTKELRKKEERESLLTKPCYLEPRQVEVPPQAAESPLSFLNSNQNQESGSKIETAHISEIDKNVPPIVSDQEDIERRKLEANVDLNKQPAIPTQTDPLKEKKLAENLAKMDDYQPPEALAINKRWRDFSMNVAKMTHYDFASNMKAIKSMAEKGVSYTQLGDILDYLTAHPDKKIAEEFVQPKLWRQLFFGQRSLLDEALKCTVSKPPSSPKNTGGTDRELMKRNDEALAKHEAFLQRQRETDEDKKKSE